MKITRLMAAVAFAASTPLLLHAQTLSQGRVASPFSETRILSDTEFGDDSSLGLGATLLGWGLDAELPLGPALPTGGHRLEYQPSFVITAGPKFLNRNGSIESQQNVEVNNQLLLWTVRRLAIKGGFRYANEWAEGVTSAVSPIPNNGYTTHRSGWLPDLGAALRDTVSGRPGRFHADYIFPTGCQRTTLPNPCAVQSPRMHGLEMMQEVRATSYLRVGVEMTVVRYYDPSDPHAPGLPRTGHTAVYANIHLKFDLRASPLNDGGVY